MNAHAPRWLYFAYGSNLNLDGMTSRCPDAVAAGAAILDDWTLTFRGVADIARLRGRRAYGALWGISGRDLERLDSYEGYPSTYRRRLVTVEVEDRRVGALTYVMGDDHIGLPSSHYYETIRQGFEQWDLPILALEVAAARAKDELRDRGLRRELGPRPPNRPV
jgi:hypothetical protein